ncbi:hypothetical protein [Malacoplasma muris]
MIDLKNIKVQHLTDDEVKNLFDKTIKAPLDKELIEIIKALADK